MSTHAALRDRLSGIAPDEMTGLWIDGRWRPAADQATFDVFDPTDDSSLRSVADGTPEDGVAALDAAVAAQADWAATLPRERAEILRRAFDLVTERADDLAALMTLEMGKSLTESAAEVTYGAEFLRWFSEEAVRLEGRMVPAPNGPASILTRKKPVGPALAITPWNFPLSMATRKLGPALAAGCTMVLKPAQSTPLTAMLLVELLHEAGVPAGVVNLVTTTRTSEVIEPLTEDHRLRKLTFTGSTPVGRILMGQSANRLLRLSMELGGNAPFVVLDDADVDAAVEGAMLAKFRNIGEACTSANRFVVHREVAEEFTQKFAAAAAKKVVGLGGDEGVDLGPLVDADALEKVTGLVADALERGARVVTGGPEAAQELRDQLGTAGHWYPPTVLADVPRDSRLLHEEIFGPVAPIVVVDDVDAAVVAANDTEYGLVGYLYTRDIGRAMTTSERMETGMVGLNMGVVSQPAAPFGGVKQSGFGREGGHEGIEEYLETQYLGLAR